MKGSNETRENVSAAPPDRLTSLVLLHPPVTLINDLACNAQRACSYSLIKYSARKKKKSEIRVKTKSDLSHSGNSSTGELVRRPPLKFQWDRDIVNVIYIIHTSYHICKVLIQTVCFTINFSSLSVPKWVDFSFFFNEFQSMLNVYTPCD